MAPGLVVGLDVSLAYTSVVHKTTTVCSLAIVTGDLQWLQGLLGSSVVPPGPAARDQAGVGSGQSQWCA